MQKQKYISELLKPKCVPTMAEADSKFKEKVEQYEFLNNKKNLDSSQKREKVILKDFISAEIKKYKTDSQSWILTNGPTGAGKPEYKEEEEQDA